MRDDLRFALRRLRQSPWFSTFAIVTLSLAIGVTTAVYSLLHHGLRPDLGLAEVDRLSVLSVQSPVTNSPYAATVSYADYQDLARQTTSWSATAAWATFSNALVVRGTSEFVSGEMVSGNYFETVGLRAVRGRMIGVSDDTPGAAPVVVLSEATWRMRFARDPSAVGATVKLAGHPFTVVGIAPAAFRGLRPRGGFERPGAFIHSFGCPGSLALHAPGSQQARSSMAIRGRPTQIRPIPQRFEHGGRPRCRSHRSNRTPSARVLQDGAKLPRPRRWLATQADDRVDFSEAREVFRVVLLLPVLVLLVAATNLSNFALSRGLARHQEFGVREAMGASRWQLIRGQLAEYGLIAVAGGAGGLAVARGLLGLVASTVRSIGGNLPEFRIDSRIDGPALLAAGAFAILAVVIAGLIPAMRLTGRGLAGAIASEQGSTALPRWRGRSNLIALQLSVTLALLLVAALCVRQLPKVSAAANSGTEIDRVGLAVIPFAEQSIDEGAARSIIDRLLTALSGMPGIETSAAASERRFSVHATLAIEGQPIRRLGPNTPTARQMSATESYFKTLGLSLVAGRAFDTRDSAASERVAIIDASMSKTLFGTTESVGRRITAESDGNPNHPVALTIVGVAQDTYTTRGSVESWLYMPFSQRFEEVVPINILARATPDRDPAQVATLLRDTLRRIDPEVAVTFVGRADASTVGPLVVLRYFSLALGSLAFLALAFAMSGLYGVLSHIVSRRTRELGVRAALGAEPAQLTRLVLRDGARPVLEGVVIGLGIAAGARLGMQPWFTEPVTAVDPVAVIVALVPLVSAAALACYLPARRASRVAPNVALRHS